MNTFIDAATFFGDHRPLGIPSDTGEPDFVTLVNRTRNLDASPYPYSILKAILDRENRRLGAGPKTIDSIASINGQTIFIVCGQQAGLFGGPLYTLYKAMHAVQLSLRLSELTGRNVLPLFWVASDDHDFEEVKKIGVKTRDGEKSTIEYHPDRQVEGVPVGEIMLDEGIISAVDSLAETLPTGEASGRYLDILRSAWKPGSRWSDAFTAQMLRLFASYGLVLFDPRWKGVKNLFRSIFIAELSDPLASAALVNKEADAFESVGMRKKALRKSVGSTNLFLTVDGVRLPLFVEKEGFRAGNQSLTKSDMFNIVNSSPDRVSPAASLRPICQDTIMPVAALICGPGERIYMEQVKPLYTLFGVSRSLVWPRASFTVIDSRIIRNAEKERIPLPMMFANSERIRKDLALDSFPRETGKALDSLDALIESGFTRAAESIALIDPTLKDSVKKDMGKVLHIARSIRERALRAHRSSLAISEKRLLSASYFLLPDGKPQERWFGADLIFTSLDDDGFDEFIKATSPHEEYHRIVLPQK